MTSQGALNNQGGRLASDAGLSLSSASLDNSQAGAISGKGAVEIRTGNLNNSRKASIGSDAGLTLVAARVDNSQAGRIAALPAQAAERAWSYSYNALGLIERADGPRTDVQDVTLYAYDSRGNLTQVTNALGQVTRLGDYDERGKPGSITDANGVTSSLAYTGRAGRAARRSCPESSSPVRAGWPARSCPGPPGGLRRR